MDKRTKKNEPTDKKIDNRVKDRGDLKKFNDKTQKKSEGTQMSKSLAYPESGDSERKTSTSEKPEKTKLNVYIRKPVSEDSKMKYLISGTTEKEFLNKDNYNKDKLAKSHSELRKRIRDRYTVKLNCPGNKSESKVATLKSETAKRGIPIKRPIDQNECPQEQISEETTQTIEKLNPSPVISTLTDPDHKPIPEKKPDLITDKKPEKIPVKTDKIVRPGWELEIRSAKKRKPIIKTIMSKTGNVRIFKAVTFVDQNKITPLEVKIPGNVIKKQQKVSKYTETSSVKYKPKVTVSTSKHLVKPEKLTKLAAVRKRAEKRRDRRFRHERSSACSLKETMSPPTEVARWAPASVDPQTTPYYEAWINTTLAAISKNSKQDKITYEKQAKLLRSFQKALEVRPESPELFYENFADEKYTGRIKIRTKERNKKQKVFT